MQNQELPQNDPQLQPLLRNAYSKPELPLGFQKAVWNRIEKAESGSSVAIWLDNFIFHLLRPRAIIATLAVMVVLGGSLGILNGISNFKQTAQARYVASVNPFVGEH